MTEASQLPTRASSNAFELLGTNYLHHWRQTLPQTNGYIVIQHFSHWGNATGKAHITTRTMGNLCLFCQTSESTHHSVGRSERATRLHLASLPTLHSHREPCRIFLGCGSRLTGFLPGGYAASPWIGTRHCCRLSHQVLRNGEWRTGARIRNMACGGIVVILLNQSLGIFKDIGFSLHQRSRQST